MARDGVRQATATTAYTHPTIREQTVSRDGEGNVLGVAFFINAEDLPDGIKSVDSVRYTVENGTVEVDL